MNKALILSLFMSISNIAIADFVKLSNEGEILDFKNSNWLRGSLPSISHLPSISQREITQNKKILIRF